MKHILRYHHLDVVYVNHHDKVDIEKGVTAICELNPDWVFLTNFVINIADDIAHQIKTYSPHLKIAGIATYKVSYQIDTVPQFLDYVHYYPLAPQHLEEAIHHLSKM